MRAELKKGQLMEVGVATLAATAQLLSALSVDVCHVLLAKADIEMPESPGQVALLRRLSTAEPTARGRLLRDLVLRAKSVRADAPVKYVFDDRLAELHRCLQLDGWRVQGDSIERDPSSSREITAIIDALDQELAESGLDEDGEVRESLRRSSLAFAASEPDFNASSMHARIALEHLARRSAALVCGAHAGAEGPLRWGAAISLFRKADMLSKEEEAALVAVYAATSSGAHLPKGLSDREWARLVRVLCQAWLFFMLRRLVAWRSD